MTKLLFSIEKEKSVCMCMEGGNGGQTEKSKKYIPEVKGMKQ